MNSGPEGVPTPRTRLDPLSHATSPEGNRAEPGNRELVDPELAGPELAGPELAAFDADLRQALRPVELPAGFADRVLARVTDAEAPRKGKLLAFPGWRIALPGAIAAGLIAGSMIGVNMHQDHVRAHRRAEATEQFETAARITDEALAHTREQLQRAGVFAQQGR